jgi:dihydrolipoamide dehydrogenase
MHRKVDVAVIGAGTAGLGALAEVRKATDSWVIIDGGELGTTCARVGCMPSKAFIQIATDFHRRNIFKRYGITGANQLNVDSEESMESVRDLRDLFVDRILEGTTDVMGDALIEGIAKFVDQNNLQIGNDTVEAQKIIIATGTSPIVPKQWMHLGERLITTDSIFEMETLPSSMAVIGLGAIGLELGQSLQRLGVKITGIDSNDRLMGLADPVVNEVASQLISKEFPVWLGHPVTIREQANGITVEVNGQTTEVDKILVSIGRNPNIKNLGLENLDVELNSAGVPTHDPHTMQVGDLPVFIAGDVTNERQILHESAFEGRIAGLNAVTEQVVAYQRPVALTIAYTEPNIVNVGINHSQALSEECVIGEMRMGPVGRALIMGNNRGVIRVYANRQDGTLRGASMVAPRGEHLGHLLALGIQNELSVAELLGMPYYHPSIEEALQSLLRDMQKQIRQQPVHPAGLAAL